MSALGHGLGQGLEQGIGRMNELAAFLGWAALVVLVGLALIPFLIWWNTSRTNRLLNELIDEQERTNELLEALITDKAEPGTTRDEPDEFTLS